MDILNDDFARAGVRISASGRVSWPESYQAYADRFGTKPRTVRKWVADGKDAGSLPPLFDPDAMVTWWKGSKRNKVPPGLLTASKEAKKGESDEGKGHKVTGVTRGNDDDGSAGRGYEVTARDRVELDGVDSALRDARREVAITHKALIEARAALKNGEGDAGTVEACRREYNSASDNLRKWEKDFQVIQEKRGLLVRKAAVQDEIGMIATNLSRAYLNSMLRLAKELAPGMAPKARRKLCLTYRDHCFDALRESEFSGACPDLSEGEAVHV